MTRTTTAHEEARDKIKVANATKRKSLKSKATTTARRAKAKVSKVSEEAVDAVSENVSQTVGKQTEKTTHLGQHKARSYMLSASRALEATSEQLEQDGLNDTASYVREAAQKLMNASETVDDFNPKYAREKAENFIQERPMVTLGGLALLGFAAATIMAKRVK